jgi:hypothetical protein
MDERAVDEGIIDAVSERDRRIRPHPALIEAAREKRSVRREIHGDHALLSDAFGARPIHSDPKEPSLEGGPAFEALKTFQHGDPGLLSDVLSAGVVSDVIAS